MLRGPTPTTPRALWGGRASSSKRFGRLLLSPCRTFDLRANLTACRIAALGLSYPATAINKIPTQIRTAPASRCLPSGS